MTRAVVPALALTMSLLAALRPVAAAGELAMLHQRMLIEAGSGAQGEEPPQQPPQQPPGQPAGQRRLLPLPRPNPVPDIARVGLERSDCLTRCPAYTVVFAPDGGFRYVGHANVERMGEHAGRVPRGSLAQVLRYVAAIGFMELDATYDDGSLDNPAAYTLVEWGGVTKVVRNSGTSAPATVWALEQLLDGLLRLATWE